METFLMLLINNNKHLVSIHYILGNVISMLLKLLYVIITKTILGLLFTNNVTDTEILTTC